jgi:hypothetical protein
MPISQTNKEDRKGGKMIKYEGIKERKKEVSIKI